MNRCNSIRIAEGLDPHLIPAFPAPCFSTCRTPPPFFTGPAGRLFYFFPNRFAAIILNDGVR